MRRNGEPVPGIVVVALSSDESGLLGIGVRTGVSDGKGNYRLLSIAPGSYIFQVSGFRMRPYTIPVEIPEGVSSVRKDLDLPSGRIEGKVLDSSGNPVEGAGIRAEPVEKIGVSGLLSLFVSMSAWRTRSRADGSFSLKHIPPGFYNLYVSPPRREERYAGVKKEKVYVSNDSPVLDLRFILPPAAAVEGIVVDGRGDPVGNATVRVAPRGKAGLISAGLKKLVLPKARTGPDGRFKLAGLETGTWVVWAEAQGHAPSTQKEIQVFQGGAAEVTLVVHRGGTVKVKVTREDGTIFPKARVKVLDENGKVVSPVFSAMDVFRRIFGGGKEENQGWYTIKNVKPGRYTVVVTYPGKEERHEVLVREGEVTELVLKVE